MHNNFIYRRHRVEYPCETYLVMVFKGFVEGDFLEMKDFLPHMAPLLLLQPADGHFFQKCPTAHPGGGFPGADLRR